MKIFPVRLNPSRYPVAPADRTPQQNLLKPLAADTVRFGYGLNLAQKKEHLDELLGWLNRIIFENPVLGDADVIFDEKSAGRIACNISLPDTTVYRYERTSTDNETRITLQSVANDYPTKWVEYTRQLEDGDTPDTVKENAKVTWFRLDGMNPGMAHADYQQAFGRVFGTRPDSDPAKLSLTSAEAPDKLDEIRSFLRDVELALPERDGPTQLKKPTNDSPEYWKGEEPAKAPVGGNTLDDPAQEQTVSNMLRFLDQK